MLKSTDRHFLPTLRALPDVNERIKDITLKHSSMSTRRPVVTAHTTNHLS